MHNHAKLRGSNAAIEKETTEKLSMLPLEVPGGKEGCVDLDPDSSDH